MKFDLATLKAKKLDLAVLRGKRLDLATLRQMKFDPKSLRQQALKLRQKLRNRSILALTLFSNECGVRLVKRDGDVVRSEARFFLPRGADALIAQPEDFGKELVELLTANNIRERQCVVCMPPSWAFTCATDVPDELTGEDLRGYLELRAEKEFPMSIGDLRLAHSAFVLPGGQRRVTVAAVPVKRIAAVEQMLATIGGKLLSLSLGLDYLLATPGAPPRVHFLANGKHVDVIITSGGGIAGVRTLSTGVPPPDPAFDAVGLLPRSAHHARPAAGGGAAGRRRGDLRRGARFRRAVARKDDGAALPHGPLRAGRDRKPDPARRPRGGRAFPARPVGDVRVRHAGGQAMAGLAAEGRQQAPAHDGRRWRWPHPAPDRRLHGAGRTWRAASNGSGTGCSATWRRSKKIQSKIRRFRPWFDPNPQTLGALETLAGAFSDNGETWAKNIQIHDGERVTCTAFAKSQAAKDEMLGRLRKKPGVSEVQTQQVRGNSPITYTFTYKWEPNHAN